MNKCFLYPYNSNSVSAKLLAQAMGIKRIKHKGSKYRARPGHVIINWGSSTLHHTVRGQGARVVNNVPAVHIATDKLQALVRMKVQGVSVPEFTTDKEVVRKSIHEGDGSVKWLARTILNGSEGKGIIIVDNFLLTKVDIPDAPLYTKYIRKKKEFRVHVINGEVVDIQQKVKKRDANNRDFLIRNTANGCIFIRDGIVVPDEVKAEAIKAVKALGLDFGGVDVIWNEKHNKAYVLECNTAPGIMGRTIETYKTKLWELIGNAALLYL